MADEACKAKHARSPDDSPPDSGHAKRLKLGPRSADRFSKAEQTILQAAAELLDVPLEHLLATASSSGSLSSNTGSPGELDETESDSSNYGQVVDEAHHDTTTAPFALTLPDFSQRSQYEPLASMALDRDVPTEIYQVDAGPSSYFDEFGGLDGGEGPSDFFNPCANYAEYFPPSMAEAEHPPISVMEQVHPFPPSMGPLVTGNMDALLPNPRSLQSNFTSGSRHGPEPSATMFHSLEDSDLQTHGIQHVREQEGNGTAVVKRSGREKKRRGRFEDPEQRRETGLTRQLKACIRCSMQRIRVGDSHSLQMSRQFDKPLIQVVSFGSCR
jgi:hypothetical protein